MANSDFRDTLAEGVVIPALPLALDRQRRFDASRQRAIMRYYSAAGAGGLAVGVHTTQFAIRSPEVGLFAPVLELACAEMDMLDARRERPLVRVAGICGQTSQAIAEAELAASLGYHCGLLSLAAMKGAAEDDLVAHCTAVADVVPVVGFYLQPAVGGLPLGYSFWRRFAEIENVVAIKIAPFNRYATLDVVRAVADSGRDIALYTGNDDSIVADLLTAFDFGGRKVRIVGGLLGHWAVWTCGAVRTLAKCHDAVKQGVISESLLTEAAQITDANAAFFDAANAFAGCIAGIHEVLRRQGLLEGIWLLDPDEKLSNGQSDEIDRVCRAYPHLADDAFVREHLDEWLNG